MKRLYTLKLDNDYGGGLWINEKSQEIKKLKGKEPFIITDDISNYEGYVDISSIENIHKYAPLVVNNHFEIKTLLKGFYDNEWDDLNLTQKKILSKFFVVDNEKVREVLTDEEYNEHNHYKLYHYLNEDILIDLNEDNFKITPKSIDYKKSVNSRLHPKMVFNEFGFLTDVIYYSELEVDTSGQFLQYNYSNPIVKYNAKYNTGSDGYTISRVTTRNWTRNDGSWSENPKVSLKIYDPISSRDEAKKRRRNLINNLLVEIVGLIMYTTPSLTTTSLAEIDAMGFFHDIETAITAYYESGTTVDSEGNPCKLVDEITKHPYERLNNMVPLGDNYITLRELLLNRINP